MKTRATSLVAIVIAGTVLTASAQLITYVDATSGDFGNTALAAGDTFNPVADASGTDGLWRSRAFGNDSTIFEAGGDISGTGSAAGGNNEDVARLATTIGGLTPGETYNVFVYFWSAGAQDWRIRAGLTNVAGDLPLFTNTDDPTAVAEDFEVPPLITQSDRILKQGSLGVAVADGTGMITVFVDDDPAARTDLANAWAFRTWYDGLGYQLRIDPFVGPTLITPPTAPVGGTAEVTAEVSGTEPFSFQWLSNGVPVLNATNQILALTNLQLADSGTSFSLMVSNNPRGIPTVVTNTPATLTVREPVDLVWVGFSSFEWNTTGIDWDSNGDGIADTAFTDADRVRFDDNGNSFVPLATNLYPSLVVVSNEFVPYTLTVFGSIGGNGPLIKHGAASLTLDMDNSYSGGTFIGGGILNVGSGLDTGSIGTGPVTNNTGLVINRTGTLSIPGVVSGPGGITNMLVGSGNFTANNVILSGANTFSGHTEVNGGTLTLAHSSALGGSPAVTVNSIAGGPGLNGTRIALSGGVSIPGTTSLSLPSGGAGTVRSTLFGTGAGTTNTWAGPITLFGDGDVGNIINFGADANSTLIISDNVTADSTFAGKILIRGSGTGVGIFSGPVALNPDSGQVQVDDGSTWIFTSTANTWATNVFAGNSTFRLGAHNALPTTSVFQLGNGANNRLDLAGFNQQVAGMNAGGIHVTNTSDSADSTLTYSSTGASIFGGTIGDSARQLNLTIAAGTLTFTNPATLNIANSTVTVNSEAVLDLAFTGTNTVAALVLDGVDQPAGTYNSGNAAPFLAGTGSLLVSPPVAAQPVISSVSAVDGNLVFNGTNGPAGSGFSVLSTTNVADALPWPVLSTGNFDGSGNFSVTNAITPDEANRYFILSIP